MEVISKEFPSRVLDKLGRQEFAQKDGCKTGIWAVHSRVSSLQYTQELAPYMDEMNAAEETKEATKWKRMEKKAGVSSRVHADIK